MKNRAMKGYKIGFYRKRYSSYPCFALIELEIPDRYPGAELRLFLGAYRSNVARVLKIYKVEPSEHLKDFNVKTAEELESAYSIFDNNFIYRQGEIVYPDKFDQSHEAICTSGIHFFGSKKRALDYIYNEWVLTQYYNSWHHCYKTGLAKNSSLLVGTIKF